MTDNKLEDDLIKKIKIIKSRLDVVCPKSLNQWINGFAKDKHPKREIKIWSYISEVYNDLRKRFQNHNNDLFKIILMCSMGDNNYALSKYSGSIPNINVEEIINWYRNKQNFIDLGYALGEMIGEPISVDQEKFDKLCNKLQLRKNNEHIKQYFDIVKLYINNIVLDEIVNNSKEKKLILDYLYLAYLKCKKKEHELKDKELLKIIIKKQKYFDEVIKQDENEKRPKKIFRHHLKKLSKETQKEILDKKTQGLKSQEIIYNYIIQYYLKLLHNTGRIYKNMKKL